MHDLVIRGGTIVDGTGAEPYVGDVAVDGDKIVAVGPDLPAGIDEIDASGKYVTPGFVDIHTHYDGQATWDAEMAPSSWHGVTTVVMGNCGVGFAPAAPDKHDWLIGLMEGVEDIPGTALAEGITWDWESFPEYIDSLENMPRTVDVGTQVPHGAVRAYVMGERSNNDEDATDEDISAMSAIVEEALKAGALGFSTSRTVLHRDVDGELVPGTTADKKELVGIGQALGRAGHGVFEVASDLNPEWNEFDWMAQLSKETGMPVSFAALQGLSGDDSLAEQLATMRKHNEEGANIYAQIALRGTGIIMGWQTTVNPFMFKPTFAEVAALPREEQLARLADPEVRQKILSEDHVLPEEAGPLLQIVIGGWPMLYTMREGFNYEPTPAESIQAMAAGTNQEPAEYAYDLMLENEGRSFIYFPVLNYADGNLDFLVDLQAADDCINSLSDGGAHCGTICDAASPTFMLEHWVRDRERGTISLAQAVKRQCRDTARLYGLEDRGVLADGFLADLNVIDLDAIKLERPWLAFDLPAGGKRLLQKAQGYNVTIKSGQVTFKDGVMQGPTPGGVIRGPQAAPAA